jgi:hypothetical protein
MIASPLGWQHWQGEQLQLVAFQKVPHEFDSMDKASTQSKIQASESE